MDRNLAFRVERISNSRHYAVFYLGLHCFSNYLIADIQNEKAAKRYTLWFEIYTMKKGTFEVLILILEYPNYPRACGSGILIGLPDYSLNLLSPLNFFFVLRRIQYATSE